MDWPSRSVWSRLRWLRRGCRIWCRRRRSGWTVEPIGWPQFERAFWAHVARRAGQDPAAKFTETLHTLRRDGRLPLIVIVAMDRSGHVVEAAACDTEDYES